MPIGNQLLVNVRVAAGFFRPLMFSVLGPRYGDIHGCRGDKENSYLENLDGSFLGFFFPFQKKTLWSTKNSDLLVEVGL